MLSRCICVLILLLVTGCGGAAASESIVEIKDEQVTTTIPVFQEDTIDAKPYLSEEAFRFGLNGDFYTLSYDYMPLKNYEYIIGGIIPHHDVANTLIADFYRGAAKIHDKDPYDVVVVVSPNHFDVGPAIQVGMTSYDTYGGILETDRPMADNLVAHPMIHPAEEEMLSKEHGQLIHMSYIRQLLRGAKVLSVVVTETGDEEGPMTVAEALKSSLGYKKVLYVASIDFSHKLPYEQAQKRDSHTEVLLKAGDRGAIFRLNDNYLDSPSTYALFARLMEEEIMTKATITNHSNSALILNQRDMANTTSYFQVIYELPNE